MPIPSSGIALFFLFFLNRHLYITHLNAPGPGCTLALSSPLPPYIQHACFFSLLHSSPLLGHAELHVKPNTASRRHYRTTPRAETGYRSSPPTRSLGTTPRVILEQKSSAMRYGPNQAATPPPRNEISPRGDLTGKSLFLALLSTLYSRLSLFWRQYCWGSCWTKIPCTT